MSRVFARGPALAALVALAACARAGTDDDRYTDLYHRMHPAVVLFTMKIPADDPKRKGQWDDAYGSGVVVQSGAWGSRILTDAHVIEDARDLRAKAGDTGKAAATKFVAKSDDDDDLALVEVTTPNLPAVRFGVTGELAPGRAVAVLGYPIPDAFEDEHLRTVASMYTGRIASLRNGTIELDAAIIPGESGGPVFDVQTGDVIGIAESRFDEERAIGFATPLDVIARFLGAHRHTP